MVYSTWFLRNNFFKRRHSTDLSLPSRGLRPSARKLIFASRNDKTALTTAENQFQTGNQCSSTFNFDLHQLKCCSNLSYLTTNWPCQQNLHNKETWHVRVSLLGVLGGVFVRLLIIQNWNETLFGCFDEMMKSLGPLGQN